MTTSLPLIRLPHNLFQLVTVRAQQVRVRTSFPNQERLRVSGPPVGNGAEPGERGIATYEISAVTIDVASVRRLEPMLPIGSPSAEVGTRGLANGRASC